MLKLDREAQWFVEGRKPSDESAWNTSLGIKIFGARGPKSLWETHARPKVAIVLGSGLGRLTEQFEPGSEQFSFDQIWPWADKELPGHAKKVVIGILAGVPTIAFSGRLHLYEGYSAEQVVQPILLARALGIKEVILTNAAGGLYLFGEVGDIMVINDHLNFTGQNPLIGENNDELGPRFPAMNNIYPGARTLLQIANDGQIPHVTQGVYAAVTGPDYETPAYISWLRSHRHPDTNAQIISAVGMSTVLEAMVAKWCGLQVTGASLITNMAAGLSAVAPNHEEVVAAGVAAYNRFSQLMLAYIATLSV